MESRFPRRYLEELLTAAFAAALQDQPVIAAVKNDAGLARALESECAVIFFLYGTILNIPQLVRKAKEKNKDLSKFLLGMFFVFGGIKESVATSLLTMAYLGLEEVKSDD